MDLRGLLEIAGVKEEAKFVWFEGADSGEFGGQRGRYRKDVTLERVQIGGVFLAFGMNGEDLELERGGPVRSIVPGVSNSFQSLFYLASTNRSLVLNRVSVLMKTNNQTIQSASSHPKLQY